MNKKSAIILFVIAIVIIGFVVLVQVLKDNNVKFKELNYEGFVELVEDKKTFGLVIEKDGCAYCESYLPKIEKVVNSNDLIYDVYYINISNLGNEDYKSFSKTISFSGTPTTVFFKDGVEMDLWTRIDGNDTSKNIKAKLKRLGYFEEESISK
ncbi:MAG TPA: thioredoxin family protein [Bacilli bacterium]|nr:thioredoxin family protein [Bacilli bacterium]